MNNQIEEKIVISKKEFWELSNKFSKKELDEIVQFHKNKIAKEIFQKIYTYYKTNSTDYLNEYFLTDLKEMAQEFGVEVK